MTTSAAALPPFTRRARTLTPLDNGGARSERDCRIEVDASGRLASVGRDATTRRTRTARRSTCGRSS